MKEKFKELNIAALEADLSGHDPKIWAYLREQLNRSTLPVNLVYPADKSRPPIILPPNLTQSIVLGAIEAAQ